MNSDDTRDLRTRHGTRDQSHLRYREIVLRRDSGICHLCGEPGAWTIDHFIPWKYGGTDHLDNLRAAHGTCNSSKGAALPEGWRESAEHLWAPGFGPQHVEELRRERQQREEAARAQDRANEIKRARLEVESLLEQLRELQAAKLAEVEGTEPPSQASKRARSALARFGLIAGWSFLIITGGLGIAWLGTPSWGVFLLGLGSLAAAAACASLYERNSGELPEEIRRRRAAAAADDLAGRVERMQTALTKATDLLASSTVLDCAHGTLRRYRGGLAETSTTGLDWAGLFCQGQTKCPAVWFTSIPAGHRYQKKGSRSPTRYRGRGSRYYR